MHVTPQSTADSVLPPTGYHRPFQPFDSAQTQGQIAIAFLVLGAVLNLGAIGLAGTQLDLLYAAASPGTLPPEPVIGNDAQVAMIAGLQKLIYISTAIAFLRWIHRTHRNLASLGVVDPKYTPGWAVGWFFVPLLSLVLPLMVMREIWKGSNPEGGPGTGNDSDWRSATVSPILNAWWGTWMLSYFLSYSIVVAFAVIGSAEGWISAIWAGILAQLLNVLAAALAIAVIIKLNRMQMEKYQMRSAIPHPGASPTPWQ